MQTRVLGHNFVLDFINSFNTFGDDYEQISVNKLN